MKPDHRQWPGKARPEFSDGPQWHPASFHALDVAAVADALLEASPEWLQRLSVPAELPAEATRRLLTRLAAIHDIGKLSWNFCELLGHSVPVPGAIPQPRTRLSHWQISYQLLVQSPVKSRAMRFIGVDDTHAARELFAATAGHHGRPPSKAEWFDDQVGVDSAIAFIDDLERLMPGEDDIDLDEDRAKRLSWAVAGLTVVADWVGSKIQWFSYMPPEVGMEDYWQLARHRARQAVAQSGIGRTPVAEGLGFRHLFGDASPRPMQHQCQSMVLTGEPTLFLLEDATGSGKTEAALLLAYRMMRDGLGEGLYVALPTMATANAMFDRLGDVYARLFDSEERPSIALAHGARHLNERFRQAVSGVLQTPNLATIDVGADAAANGRVESMDVAAYCSEWIADDRRKAFLADVGVGTIDQAFMSVLPLKYLALRQFGLSRRILIVDEAHACDPYMEEELTALLELQATLGGSAIVMTATLPDRLRNRLIAAYRTGLGTDGAFRPAGKYPMMTTARRQLAHCHAVWVPPFEASCRRVPVNRLPDMQQAIERLADAARSGACCVWIRNSVDDAIAAYERLAAMGLNVTLFHARFALGDRLVIERDIVERFGPKAASDRRHAQILIATQVVEQSLDLDFDVMVSDLAPIDALIQRIGRLWRHATLRPAAARPVEAPVLHVVSPDPDVVADAKWGQDAFGNSGFVYGVALLWRTATALFAAGELATPEGIRPLIEAVVGDQRKDVPAVLEPADDLQFAKASSKQALGRMNVITPAGGYLSCGAHHAEEHFPTRADTDGRRAILTVRRHGTLEPWIEGDMACARSEIGLRASLLKRIQAGGGTPAESEASRPEERPLFARDWPDWRWQGTPLLEVEPDGMVGESAVYDCRFGLRLLPA